MKHFPTLVLFFATVSGLGVLAARSAPAMLRFDFGSGKTAPDHIAVRPDSVYSAANGYGFEPGASLAAGPVGVASDQPFFFTARVPEEGNYRVTVILGDGTHATVGKFARATFIVNTRTPRIAAVGDIKAGEVKLKAPRETTQEAWAWDDAITLEFGNAHPAVSRIEIEKVEDVPTVFLIGDSTVCDQSREPYNSWGQMFTRWFKPEVAIANHGESGETYRDSIGRRRLDKMLSVMKPGDFMLMQFGHNDQKQIALGNGGPFTTYKAEIKKHVEAVRAHGGTPVIVSPMERRNFGEDGRLRPSLADYAEAARQSAKELEVAFIDLNAMSQPFYQALGPEKSAAAFAEPSPGKVDNTHHNNYGSYELSKCIVQAIRQQKLPLAKFIVDDFKDFDPAHPDDPAAFAVPPSPLVTTQRPLGDDANAPKK
jgi:lysophospholipase L1-like esterase